MSDQGETHTTNNGAPQWERLPTEARLARSMALDSATSEDIVGLILEEDRSGLEAALAQQGTIARVADLLAQTLDQRGRVLFAGAGTSGRLGVLEAAECPPTFGTDPERIAAAIAGGPDAVFRAVEGAEDVEAAGREAVAHLGGGDLLLAVSASSVTPFAHGALRAAAESGARTVLVTCAPAKGLENLADEVIGLDTGPEVLTGSTRLKAGSATKAVLNAITTTAMVRTGKVFENLMVDLRPGSAKLRDRAVRIVAAATSTAPAEARRLLDQADQEVKTAIVMGRINVGAAVARQKLAAAHGHVRRVVELPQ